MSVFAPRSMVGGGPDQQKKALLQRLMEQYQQSASRASGLGGGQAGAPTVAGVGALGHLMRHFGGLGTVTGVNPLLRSDILSGLGPGGFGHGIPGTESSMAPGRPVNIPVVANPHAGGPTAPGTPIPVPAGNIVPNPSAPTMPSAPAAAISAVMPSGSPLNPASLLMPGGTQIDPRTGAMRGAPSPFTSGIPRNIF